jgi:hypothetical protein
MADYALQIVQVVAYAVTATAAVRSAQAEEVNANAQADALEYNAKAMENQAQTAQAQANAAEELQRRRARQQEGSLRAALNQTGTAGGTGIGVLEQSSVNAELDALNVRYEGQIKATALEDEAKLNRYEAKAERQRGKDAKRGGYLSAVGGLLANTNAVADSFRTSGKG